MIYLDNNSTTQINPEVLEEVKLFLEKHWGNPNSSYPFGARERNAIENARENVARLINAQSSEIIFTSCATESSNMAFHSALTFNKEKKHIVTSAVEHSSILEICKSLNETGYAISYIDVNEDGNVDLDAFEKSINNETCLISMMWANNETGVIFPIEKISEICSRKNVLFHCDASQAAGKIPIDLDSTSIDYLSISGHKMYAPKGIGALYVRQGAPLSPLIKGGGQEHGLRGGTYNTAYIVGMGKAAELAIQQIEEYKNRVKCIRDYFENQVKKSLPQIYFNGKDSPRLPNTSNIGIPNIDSDIILNYLSQHDIYISSGSACTSDAITPSHVIQAMRDYEKANETLRISLSLNSTEDEILALIQALKDAYDILN